MYILVDKRMPLAAKESLSRYGELVEIATSGITYDTISGHPDIFFCKTESGLIVAPNLPPENFIFLKKKGIAFTIGELPVGKRYPESSRYNAVFTSRYLIHNELITDRSLIKEGVHLDRIHVSQGYCRCNLLNLGDDYFITSDRGIEKALQQIGLIVKYVSPAGICLEGQEYGFFGGCCGCSDNRIFINGSLDHFADGEKVRSFAKAASFEIIELNDGPLIDTGGILFLSYP